jgi:5'(3')-deoxyribonucleotidase
MKRRMRTLVDVDDVVANFRWAYGCAALKAIGKVHYQTDEWSVDQGLTPAESAIMEEVVRSSGFLDMLEPLPFARSAVKELNTFSDVYFVTAHKTTAPTWTHDRTRWLVKHFGVKLGNQVAHTKHKHMAWGDLFIDDKPDHALAWIEAMKPLIPHAQAWLREWGYNRDKGVPTFNDWKDIIEVAQRIKEQV